jgi:hypothetical protein
MAKIHAKNKERCARMTFEERRAMFKGREKRLDAMRDGNCRKK